MAAIRGKYRIKSPVFHAIEVHQWNAIEVVDWLNTHKFPGDISMSKPEGKDGISERKVSVRVGSKATSVTPGTVIVKDGAGSFTFVDVQEFTDAYESF